MTEHQEPPEQQPLMGIMISAISPAMREAIEEIIAYAASVKPRWRKDDQLARRHMYRTFAIRLFSSVVPQANHDSGGAVEITPAFYVEGSAHAAARHIVGIYASHGFHAELVDVCAKYERAVLSGYVFMVRCPGGLNMNIVPANPDQRFIDHWQAGIEELP